MDPVRTNPPARRVLAAVIVCAAALTAAGCGLSGSGASSPTRTAASSGGKTAGSPQTAMLAFAQCVRRHGVPGFPDPSGGKMTLQEQNGKTVVNGVPLNVSSSTFQAAQRACRSLLPVATGTAANPQLKAKALAFAQCMRTHGVANFPDPKVVGNGIQVQYQGDMGSSTFQAAQKACQSILPRPGGGG